MTARTYTFPEWFRYVARCIREGRPEDADALPIADVCDRLDVTKQAVHKLLEGGKLESVSIVTKRGNVAVILVPRSSLDFYLSHRRPFSSDGRFTLTPEAG